MHSIKSNGSYHADEHFVAEIEMSDPIVKANQYLDIFEALQSLKEQHGASSTEAVRTALLEFIERKAVNLHKVLEANFL